MLIVLSLILLRYCICIRPVSRFSFNFILACSAVITQFTYFAVWLSSIKWNAVYISRLSTKLFSNMPHRPGVIVIVIVMHL